MRLLCFFLVLQLNHMRKMGALNMSIFKKAQNLQGGYFFLSHSHKDIQQVRQIRNQLEDDGFEPLCFYLKCLSDDSEIEDLIKREIDAREWFVFLDSENARKSKWVTLEREYITTRSSKKVIRVNLHDTQAVAKLLDRICHNLRVFLTSLPDADRLAERIKEQLAAKDYLVFHASETIHTSLSQAQDATISAVDALQDAAQEGAVVILLTRNNMQFHLPPVLEEVFLTGNLFPVIVGDYHLTPYYDYLLKDKKKFYLPTEPTDEIICQMIDQIGRYILSQLHTSATT